MTQQREAKRPYGGSQPHITSYFPQQSQLQDRQHQPQHQQQQPLSSSSYSISHDLSIDTTSVPSLPHSVQSNLLSVGMRVRKSVPEGYKTGSEYSAFNLFSESKSLPCTPTAETSHRSSGRPRANAGARELMPFCGLLKVGGMGGQQQAWGIYSPTKERSWSRYDCHGVEDMVPDEEDVPFLSQGSTDSNFSAVGTPKGHKRRCEWDDSGDDEETVDADNEAQMGAPFVLGGRTMAVPRRRKSPSNSNGGGRQTKVFGEDMDFGEAEFLDFAGFKGVEVEMGGL